LSRVLGLSLVGHFSHETGVAVDSVGDLLETTVGELDVVGTLSVVSVSAFLVTEVVSDVVLHSIVEVVLCWPLKKKFILP